MAARALSDEPHSQIAMVLAKCDLTRSERTLETTQAQVHAALRQALGAEHSMERITYYRTSAKTQGGVDDLFRDIGKCSFGGELSNQTKADSGRFLQLQPENCAEKRAKPCSAVTLCLCSLIKRAFDMNILSVLYIDENICAFIRILLSHFLDERPRAWSKISRLAMKHSPYYFHFACYPHARQLCSYLSTAIYKIATDKGGYGAPVLCLSRSSTFHRTDESEVGMTDSCQGLDKSCHRSDRDSDRQIEEEG